MELRHISETVGFIALILLGLAAARLGMFL